MSLNHLEPQNLPLDLMGNAQSRRKRTSIPQVAHDCPKNLFLRPKIALKVIFFPEVKSIFEVIFSLKK